MSRFFKYYRALGFRFIWISVGFSMNDNITWDKIFWYSSPAISRTVAAESSELLLWGKKAVYILSTQVSSYRYSFKESYSIVLQQISVPKIIKLELYLHQYLKSFKQFLFKFIFKLQFIRPTNSTYYLEIS